MSLLALAGLAAVSLQPTTKAAVAECPSESLRSAARWPGAPKGKAFDVVHFGEGHWNEGQGPETMPQLVQDVRAFAPEFVLFSSDIADTGTRDRLTCFRSIMSPLDRAGIPWFNSPGNHDRVPVAGPGGVVSGGIQEWREVFADMPAPWGDDPVPDERFRVGNDEPTDGNGASTHYYFDFIPAGGKGGIRVVVLDNSMHSLTNSDTDQYPSVGAGQQDAAQLAFLERVAREAEEKELLTWVVMHQPTRDPRDITNAHPSSYNHVMGKGASPDNALFEAIASASGVDAVFLGHIQGNAVYQVNAVDYFIDGGGGGSPYAMHSVGTDTGYYYGFRIIRVTPRLREPEVRSYFVPLVEKVQVETPSVTTVGEEIALTASARQPHDPDLPPRAGLLPNEPIVLELQRPEGGPEVPQLAYMWETLDPEILRPVADDLDPADDPSFDHRTMTMTGRFEAVGAGVARLRILVGSVAKTVRIKVQP